MRERSKLGRPREFDENEALEAIMCVFWSRGFEGTSMRDLVEATGLKKGSLYAAFGDKRLMYQKALKHYDRTWIEHSLESLKSNKTPLARIDNFLHSAVESISPSAGKRGCFVCNAAVDQASVDPISTRIIQASLARLEEALRGAVSAFLKEVADRPAKAQRVSEAAHHLMTVYFGLRVLAKAGAASDVLGNAKSVALQWLGSLQASRHRM